MNIRQRGETGPLLLSLVARKRMEVDDLALALDPHGVDLEPGELVRQIAGRLRGKDVGAVDLGRGLEP